MARGFRHQLTVEVTHKPAYRQAPGRISKMLPYVSAAWWPMSCTALHFRPVKEMERLQTEQNENMSAHCRRFPPDSAERRNLLVPAHVQLSERQAAVAI